MIVPEIHHAVPRCLLRLHDQLSDSGITDSHSSWIEFTLECERWRVPVTISRSDLEQLVEDSTEVLEREKHRLLHQRDFVR